MASYMELIREDVYKSYDATSWPPSVSQFVRSLQNELKIPGWFRPLAKDSVQYTNESVVDLVDQVCASSDDLWDNTDNVVDRDTEQRLRAAFNTALVDCARIRAVIEAENLTNTPFPKESFLVILVRNAVMDAHAQLSSLEDVPVVLPRHFSGEAVPILRYMTKVFYAPLVISIFQEMPVEKSDPSPEHRSSDEEDFCVESELFNRSPPTMSEFLNACERTKTEEDEEVQEEGSLPPHFEAHFLAYSQSAASPSVCHVPVLCMADEERLPLLMSSLLYQRRVWHINDPLVGLEFSKYSTTIRLFVGWLEQDLASSRVLPRVHLGEIRTPFNLDLSLPPVALVVSRLLRGLESHVYGVRDSIDRSVGAIISEIQSYSSFSWRIDTGIQKDDSASILENHITRDAIVQWIKSQECSAGGDIMSPRKETGKTNSPGSTSSSSPQQSTTRQPSYPPPPSSATSGEESLLVPELREPYTDTDSIPTLRSPFSCSAFAATTEKDDTRVFRWMFDRRVIPQSIPFDSKFRMEYSDMTGFIWPETWRVREDLPPVDAALEPYIRELLEGIAALKLQPGGVKCIPVEEFPVDLRILEHSFSAIFQASRRSREKRERSQNTHEAAWRHDHDRLLFDFFIRLVQPARSDAAHTPHDGHSIAHQEDPLSRPTVETTLRFPKADIFQSGGRLGFQYLIYGLVNERGTDLESWFRERGPSLREYGRELDSISFALSHWSFWRRVTEEETEAMTISKLSEDPLTGRCDALGRLLVELPNVSLKDIGHFPLVVRAARKDDGGKGRNKAKASAARARLDKNQVKASIGTTSNSLTVPDGSPGTRTTMDGTRYTIPFSSVPLNLNEGQTGLVESMDALTSKTQRIQLGTERIYLELPILTAEYKKASDNLMKGTNQVRMYLVSSVKFLQAVGITNVPVYGVQTDGPIVVLPAAVIRDDNFVYLFERLVERLDISTPVGAWHYATILCRLAQNHAKVLENRFEQVKDSLAASLRDSNRNQGEGWTMDDQIAGLKAENRAKSPPRKALRAQEPEVD